MTSIITVGFMGLSFLCACNIFYNVALTGETLSFFLPLWTWLDLELLSFQFGGFYDTLSAVMLVVVTCMSLCIHTYSLEYMKNDPHLQRFLCYLSLFSFGMLVLVSSNNFIQLFLGWELIGLMSYLLIGFWYTRIETNKCAIKAVLVNRIGDTAFAIAIFLIFRITGSVDFDTVFLLADQLTPFNINLICFFLFLAAVGKSAQLGLHTWLPDAMAGPTPVSALLHSSTMVTAGVFLILRCSPLFNEATYILPIIVILGSLTTFFAATTALVQTDLKKVIAYSTCSQLGYMVTACGLSSYNASIFHLSNHATFKALLFLTAGSIIHSLGDEQDIRKMGGLANLLPFSYAMLLIGSLALMGFPFLSGYYSKDVILEVAYAKFTVTSHFAFWLGSLSAFFTSFYSMRLLFATFLGEVNVTKTNIAHMHDAPLLMALPMGFLSLLSIFVGYFTRDIFVGFGTPFWGKSLAFTSADFASSLNAEFLPFYIKIIPVVFSTLGTLTAILYFSFFVQQFNVFSLSQTSFSVYTFLSKKWFVDKIYNEFIVQYVLSSGYNFSYKALDRGFFEVFGPTGITNFLETTTTILTKQQIGLPYSHIRQLTFAILYFFLFVFAFSLNLPLEFFVLILFAV